MTLLKIKFKRTEDSKEEYGLLIEETETIIDSAGHVVEGMIYNLDRQHYDFCIYMSSILSK